MKRVLAIILTLALTLCLTACGGNGTDSASVTEISFGDAVSFESIEKLNG